MATRGDSKNIIVGAAQLFVAGSAIESYPADPGPGWDYLFASTDTTPAVPVFDSGAPFADTLEADENWRNVGYTTNGLEVQFQPDFGEVQVDQLLDVAKMYKQGMKVNMVTAFAEGTLENLVVAIAAAPANYDEEATDGPTLDLVSGELGEVPVERAIVAVGPGSGDPAATGANKVERVYVAHRALSIENVSVMAKRDAPSTYEVSFRLLPVSNGSYGKIVDRVVGV